MKKKTKKPSVSDKIMKVITKTPRDAEKLRKELKDSLGFTEKPEDIRVNLLYLLRRGKIKRQKEGKTYVYYME